MVQQDRNGVQVDYRVARPKNPGVAGYDAIDAAEVHKLVLVVLHGRGFLILFRKSMSDVLEQLRDTFTIMIQSPARILITVMKKI